MLLSIPSALLAVLCLLARLPPHVAIAAAVFPRVFPVAEDELRAATGAPHVVFGRAKGLSATRIFLAHIVPGTLPPLFALVGVSIVFAIGVSIPIEALLDFPGLGQLAWKAALGRDLPVLVTITLLMTGITIAVNWCIDVALLAARLKSV
jgi:peptide/nickel transport system permease protein